MNESPDGSIVASCDGVTRTYTRSQSRSYWRSLFGSHETPPTVTALNEIDLTIQAGELVGIKGPSGSGKSTLLHLLAGLETPSSGTVTIAGRSTDTLSRGERTRLRLDSIGIVFQRFHLLSALPAQSNVAVPLVEEGVKKSTRRKRAQRLLERVGLGDRLDHTPGMLSGGEQQRVAIARALVTDPDLVIADEPTGELDTETGQQITALFEEICADGTAVVLASHDTATLSVADRIVELRDGVRIDG